MASDRALTAQQLLRASRHGDTETLRKLLRGGCANVDVTDEKVGPRNGWRFLNSSCWRPSALTNAYPMFDIARAERLCTSRVYRAIQRSPSCCLNPERMRTQQTWYSTAYTSFSLNCKLYTRSIAVWRMTSALLLMERRNSGWPYT
jgi:hypothetical protein